MRVLATLPNPNIPAKPSNSLILTRPLRGQTFALQTAHQGLVVFTERNLLRTRTHYWHSTLPAGSCRLRGQGSVRASRHILRCLAPSPPSRVCEQERSYSPPALIARPAIRNKIGRQRGRKHGDPNTCGRRLAA